MSSVFPCARARAFVWRSLITPRSSPCAPPISRLRLCPSSARPGSVLGARTERPAADAARRADGGDAVEAVAL